MRLTPQVENLVLIELAYINTKHPDFAEARSMYRGMSDCVPPPYETDGRNKSAAQSAGVSTRSVRVKHIHIYADHN